MLTQTQIDGPVYRRLPKNLRERALAVHYALHRVWTAWGMDRPYDRAACRELALAVEQLIEFSSEQDARR